MGNLFSSVYHHLSPSSTPRIDSTLTDAAHKSLSRTNTDLMQVFDVDIMSATKRSPLLEVVTDGTFWTLPDTDLLYVLKKEFSNELNFLKHAYSIRQHGWQEKPGSPSRVIYPDEDIYDEVNRSLVGVLALRWINNNDYDKFTCGQSQPVRLRRESFQWIHDVFKKQQILHSKDYKLYALVTSMVANDLGKSTSFVKMYHDATGEDIAHENHDMILHKAAQRGMVPAIERLQSEFRNDLKRGIKLGAEFNVGQLAQAEDAPASLAPLLDMMHHEGVWNMRWMEQLLDIAGAAGHEDHSCASKLIEPIFRSYRSVYDIVIGIVQGKLTLREGYDQNLSTRYHLIISSGWQPPKPLTVARPQDRTLMRLFCMGNVANSGAADLYYNTFYSDFVGDSIRQRLVQHFSRDGTVDKPAVQPTYGPGMMSLALTNFEKAQGKEGQDSERPFANVSKQRTLAAMLRYLARVFAEPSSSEIVAEGNVTVIERDCRVVIKSIIESDEFLRNPDILDTAPLPRDAVANR